MNRDKLNDYYDQSSSLNVKRAKLDGAASSIEQQDPPDVHFGGGGHAAPPFYDTKFGAGYSVPDPMVPDPTVASLYDNGVNGATTDAMRMEMVSRLMIDPSAVSMGGGIIEHLPNIHGPSSQLYGFSDPFQHMFNYDDTQPIDTSQLADDSVSNLNHVEYTDQGADDGDAKSPVDAILDLSKMVMYGQDGDGTVMHGLYTHLAVPIFSGTLASPKKGGLVDGCRRRGPEMSYDVLADDPVLESIELLPTFDNVIEFPWRIDVYTLGELEPKEGLEEQFYVNKRLAEALYIRALKMVLKKCEGYYIFPRVFRMIECVRCELQKWENAEPNLGSFEAFHEFRHNLMVSLQGLIKDRSIKGIWISTSSVIEELQDIVNLVFELLVGADLDTLRLRADKGIAGGCSITSNVPITKISLDKPLPGIQWQPRLNRWVVRGTKYMGKGQKSQHAKWYYYAEDHKSESSPGIAESFQAALRGKELGILPNGAHFYNLFDPEYNRLYEKAEAVRRSFCDLNVDYKPNLENPLLNNDEFPEFRDM